MIEDYDKKFGVLKEETNIIQRKKVKFKFKIFYFKNKAKKRYCY